MGALKRNKTVCECKYCGWEGMPWNQDHIYECKDWEMRTRGVRQVCPICSTIDAIEYKDYDNIEDHPLLIENRDKMIKMGY